MGVSKRLGMQVKVSTSLRKKVDNMIGTGKNVAIKKALRNASKFPKQGLLKEVRLLRTVSEQSTGATANAIISKAQFPSQGNRNYGYAYTGVDMSYEQTTSKTPDFSGAGKVRAHVRNAKIAGRSKRRRTRRGKIQVRAVKGYQKRIRHSRKSGTKPGSQLSIPGMYWHLINEGFTHKVSGRRFPGYKFQQATEARTKQQILNSMKSDITKFFSK